MRIRKAVLVFISCIPFPFSIILHQIITIKHHLPIHVVIIPKQIERKAKARTILYEDKHE